MSVGLYPDSIDSFNDSAIVAENLYLMSNLSNTALLLFHDILSHSYNKIGVFEKIHNFVYRFDEYLEFNFS